MLVIANVVVMTVHQFRKFRLAHTKIVAALQRAKQEKPAHSEREFGDGKSTERFTELLHSGVFV
jgi:hypothetical protein